MEETLLVIKPYCRERIKEKRLTDVLERSLKDVPREEVTTVEELETAGLQNRKILFAASLGESGINLELYGMLKKIRKSPGLLEGSAAGLIVDGDGELYTKSVARDIVFSANNSGCAFLGRPLVEGTGSLKNFNIQAKNLGTDNQQAYETACRQLVRRLTAFAPKPFPRPKLLAVHAGNQKTSSTLLLWETVKTHLTALAAGEGRPVKIEEISLRNGAVVDCVGCPYSTCRHFGEKGQCVYGGMMVEKVYPAILQCDALVMVCPNYNDAISANLAAFVNRLTALFLTNDFSEKKVFAVIVSGYSGSDLLARQIISGINMNKSFILPGRFSLMETGNDRETLMRDGQAEKNARKFAEHILRNI